MSVTTVPETARTERREPAAVRPRVRRGRLRAVFVKSIALVLLLAAWEIAPRAGLVDPVFLPPFHTVLGALADLAGNGQLAANAGASLTRSLAGFAVAVVTAVPLGVAIGWYKPVSDVLTPLVQVFLNTAALALLPVFVLILGIGETSKIAIVFYACTWPILLNTISAVRSVDPTLLKLARSLDLSAPRLFARVVLPASVPTIFTGIRLAGAAAIVVVIAAEMVGAKAGLGYLINFSQYNFAIPQMYAGIVAISVLGVAFNQLLVTVERRFTSWRTDR
ncbi:ABC transporter permease [Amycolatopsis sp. FU40]|uniref:ABC transporter permease n=1 Tax=Amycolatopsis sp. FU40 TaxID=2914159 RepID=UPI001F303A97|nr:ABC transporter permease [Amycolatopsis sp. FU40]UKD56873.1 ABC transporter permease [Amycolatopsis sp. FU40]